MNRRLRGGEVRDGGGEGERDRRRSSGGTTMNGKRVRPRRRLLPSDRTRQKLSRGGSVVIPAWSPGLGIDVEMGGRRRQKRRQQTVALPWSSDVGRSWSSLSGIDDHTRSKATSKQRICQTSLVNGILETKCQERNLTDILDSPDEIPPETVELKYQNNQVRVDGTDRSLLLYRGWVNFIHFALGCFGVSAFIRK